eukprot:1475048-Rhodomonas_salina.2
MPVPHIVLREGNRRPALSQRSCFCTPGTTIPPGEYWLRPDVVPPHPHMSSGIHARSCFFHNPLDTPPQNIHPTPTRPPAIHGQNLCESQIRPHNRSPSARITDTLFARGTWMKLSMTSLGSTAAASVMACSSAQ